MQFLIASLNEQNFFKFSNQLKFKKQFQKIFNFPRPKLIQSLNKLILKYI